MVQWDRAGCLANREWRSLGFLVRMWSVLIVAMSFPKSDICCACTEKSGMDSFRSLDDGR